MCCAHWAWPTTWRRVPCGSGSDALPPPAEIDFAVEALAAAHAKVADAQIEA